MILACVAEAKAVRDAAAAARAKYDAAEADRDRVIRDAVAAVQQSVYRHTYAPADVAALDAKAEKAYRKKFPKFEKALRKKWKHDAALSAPYVVPDEAALVVVLGGLEVKGS